MKPRRFNLSRPHSPYDHSRTCAVVGCDRKARSGSDLYAKHDNAAVWAEIDAYLRARGWTYDSKSGGWEPPLSK